LLYEIDFGIIIDNFFLDSMRDLILSNSPGKEKKTRAVFLEL
jgi:hypothetical protein